MSAARGNSGTPDPELLAAYVDGEFEGRDGVDDLRRRVESWLETDPAAREIVGDYRRLRKAWSVTSPQEPGRDVWQRLLARVRKESQPARNDPSHKPHRRRWSVV